MTGSTAYTVKLGCEIRASTEDLFDAFTRPEVLSRWFTTSARVDLRVGGRYSNADHDKGEYLIVERPSRLRFTWENEEHCPGTIVDITFHAAGERSKIALEHSRIGDPNGYEDMREGWNWALDSLKSYLEDGHPIPFEDWQKRKAGP